MKDRNINYKSPIYLQLRAVIKDKIGSGQYLPGVSIPSENEFSRAYGINRLTVRNAISTLVEDGLLKRVKGKGVYVVNKKIQRNLDSLHGFRQTMIEKNLKPKIKVLIKAIREAGGKYGCLFNIAKTDRLYYIKRLCYANDTPISLEEIYIPYSIIPKLNRIDLSIFSMYDVYDFYGIEIIKARQTLDIVKLDRNDARTLNIDNSLSVMLFECTSYDNQNNVVEFSRSYTRGDKCSFSVHFSK